jgi:formylglycine-generating enzyme required for sulfatase activity
VTVVDDVEAWDAAGIAERVAVARASCQRFGLEFVQIRDCNQAGVHHAVAVARFDGAEWMLVPGGRVRLGYEPESFTPSAAELASYEDSRNEYGLPELEQFLQDVLPVARWVDVGPLWMEARSRPMGQEAVDLSSESAQSGGATYRSPDGTTYRQQPVAPIDCIAAATRPCRLPTPDEWEWACRAGTSTLFRWGDRCPSDEYPVENAKFGEHRRPNAFGLWIATDPYDYEPTADPTVAVGGDGGGMMCGGSGFLLGWLALASAWRLTLDDPDVPVFGLHMRRCMPLSA